MYKTTCDSEKSTITKFNDGVLCCLSCVNICGQKLEKLFACFHCWTLHTGAYRGRLFLKNPQLSVLMPLQTSSNFTSYNFHVRHKRGATLVQRQRWISTYICWTLRIKAKNRYLIAHALWLCSTWFVTSFPAIVVVPAPEMISMNSPQL